MSELRAAGEREVDLSVLFISYNRPDLLEIAVRAIRERVASAALTTEFLVSDDGSDPEHLALVQAIQFDNYVLAPGNRGLGNNCNKGIAATRGRFILQIQDDCEFVGPADGITRALAVLVNDDTVGLVQFTHAPGAVPHEFRSLADGTRYTVFENDGIPEHRRCEDRPYTDQPHLKRRRFCDDIGPYKERVPMTIMELDFQQRVACQQRWRVAHISQPPFFRHLGEFRTFNPSNLRAARIAALEAIPVLGNVLRISRLTAKRLARAVGLR